MIRLLLISSLLTPLAVSLPAAEPEDWAKSTKFSGYMIGDFYWMATHHTEEIEGRQGFWFRRIYLTMDHKLSDKLATRFRLEMASPGDFESSDKLEPFVKDAYLQWKPSKAHSLYFGLSSTPTWNVVEGFWGYRSVEKTPLNLQKLGSSRDFGLAAKGKLGSQGKVKYHVMFGNGASTKAETNNGKKTMLSLGFYPSDSFFLEAYGDFDSRPDGKDRIAYQGFLGYKPSWGRIGLQFAHQDRRSGDGDTLGLNIGSAFAVFEATEKTHILLRYDRMFDANPDGEKISYLPFASDAKSSLVIAGIDFRVHEKLSLIPNVEYIHYDGATGDDEPDNDLVLRATFFWRF